MALLEFPQITPGASLASMKARIAPTILRDLEVSFEMSEFVLTAYGRESGCRVHWKLAVPEIDREIGSREFAEQVGTYLDAETERVLPFLESLAVLKGEPSAIEARELRSLRDRLYRIVCGGSQEFHTLVIRDTDVENMGLSELERWIRVYEKGEKI